MPTARPWPRAILALGIVALVLAAGWVAVTAIRTGSQVPRRALAPLLTVDRPFPTEGRYPGDPYAGSQVCAECHSGEAALHARSGHARTLRPASRLALARRLDGTTLADPEQPDVRWSYHYRDGRLELERATQRDVRRWVVEYAFGSGHHATTFVNLRVPSLPEILEHRLTHYTQGDTLDITPGQDKDSRGPEWTPYGNELTPRNSRKCFRCHSTQMAASDGPGIDEETMIPNVTCERCHGPGRAHVAAARRGAPADQLTLPLGRDQWTAESQMKVCGTCHRHPSGARPGQIRPDNPFLARFQPVGILQSKCYRQSGGALSCVTCHDPHARAATDRASYNPACLTCHAGDDRSGPRAGSTPGADTPCPISPQGHCVDCHMPRVDSGQHILFTDHWIRVRRPGEATSRPNPPAAQRDLLDPAEP